ncbi:HAD family hydrolase [Candidatus Woesearchaeota archaeon]|nr:HAD family hydrolase [Candidatus Woesearchaeota archaeon]
MASQFHEVLGAEIDPSKAERFYLLFKKYDIKPEECLFVTDTLGDILEANQVMVKTIAVDFGFHERKRLKKGNPAMIVSTFSELVKAIRKF